MTNHRTRVNTPYDYLSERFILAQALCSSVRIVPDSAHWGAKVIQARLAREQLTVRVTDALMPDPGDGSLVHCLSEWNPDRRRPFSDLHWCVDVLSNGDRVARHQAIDSELHSLRPALREALRDALDLIKETV